MAENLALVLCGLEPSLAPHAVLCKGMAAQLVCARQLQVWERGSTRPRWMRIAVYEGASAGVQAIARDQGRKPLAFFAFYEAGLDGFSKDGLQAEPRRVP